MTVLTLIVSYKFLGYKNVFYVKGRKKLFYKNKISLHVFKLY